MRLFNLVGAIKAEFVLVLILILAFAPGSGHAFTGSIGAEDGLSLTRLKEKVDEHFAGQSTGRGSGYKQIGRVLSFLDPRIGDQQKIPNVSAYAASAIEAVKLLPGAPSWSFVGPSEYTPGQVSAPSSLSLTPGLGRLNGLAVDPTDPKSIYVASASGGIWRTRDGGSNWIPLTDNALSMAYSDLVIDPANPSTLYAMTGDGDGFVLPSIGVLKSTDGGTNWKRTDLRWDTGDLAYGFRLAMDPTDSTHLLAASTDGLFRTTDAGESWALAAKGNFRDTRFAPGQGDIIYAARTDAFLRSNDGGQSFDDVTQGLPVSAKGPSSVLSDRVAIGVSTDDPKVVYALYGGSQGFAGLYRSDDWGKSFKLRSLTPNILDSSPNGSGNISHAWYDLAIAVDPQNVDILNLGAVNTWRSTDGGVTWELTSFWQYAYTKAPYVHPDVHRLLYGKGTLYAATDGGLYTSTDKGTSWFDISKGLAITQIFRVCVGRGAGGKIYFGSQDNGTNLLQGPLAVEVWGGDGTTCQVSPDGSNRVFMAQQFGNIFRSNDAGFSFQQIWPNAPASPPQPASYVTPYQLHPQFPAYIYACYADVYLGQDFGTYLHWEPLTKGVIGSAACVDMEVAPSDASIVYVAKPKAVYQGVGQVWTRRTGVWPSQNSDIAGIAVNPGDPLHVWITLSGYDSGHKVYESRNGGLKWTNLTGSLSNIAFNSVLAEGGDKNGVYVGGDIGVYYRNDSMTDWGFVSKALPRVIIRDLVVQGGSNRLIAATYGRGIWETSLIDPPK